MSKCELIADESVVIADSFIQSFQRVVAHDASLLGAPLFTRKKLDAFWSDRYADLVRASHRLSLVGSQDALLLLRASFSAPRVQHLLRCSPHVDHDALVVFDTLIRSTLNRITNSDLT